MRANRSTAITNAEADSLLATTSIKRKAQADAQDYLSTSKRACPSPQNELARSHHHARCTPRYGSFDAPEAGSLADIMRENCRERLYLPPVLWTPKHLTHLGCQFIAKELPKSTRLDHTKPLTLRVSSGGRATVEFVNSPRQWAVRSAQLLCKPSVPEARASAVRGILAACHFDSSKFFSPSFYFGPIAVDLKVHGVFASEPGSSPSLAYIDLELLQLRREDYIRRKFTPRIREEGNEAENNNPVYELIRKKIRRLQPKNQLEDPYVVATLIALAQHQYRRARGLSDSPMLSNMRDKDEGGRLGALATVVMAHKVQEAPLSESFKVHVLAMPCVTAPKLCLYTACIPPAFLEKLESPSTFSASDIIPVARYALSLRKPERLPDKLDHALRTAEQ